MRTPLCAYDFTPQVKSDLHNFTPQVKSLHLTGEALSVKRPISESVLPHPQPTHDSQANRLRLIHDRSA